MKTNLFKTLFISGAIVASVGQVAVAQGKTSNKPAKVYPNAPVVSNDVCRAEDNEPSTPELMSLRPRSSRGSGLGVYPVANTNTDQTMQSKPVATNTTAAGSAQLVK